MMFCKRLKKQISKSTVSVDYILQFSGRVHQVDVDCQSRLEINRVLSQAVFKATLELFERVLSSFSERAGKTYQAEVQYLVYSSQFKTD